MPKKAQVCTAWIWAHDFLNRWVFFLRGKIRLTWFQLHSSSSRSRRSRMLLFWMLLPTCMYLLISRNLSLFVYLLAYIYTKQSSTYFLSRFRGRKIISDCEALHTIFQGKVFRDEDQIFTNLVLSWLQLSPLSTLTLPLFTLATRELFTPPLLGVVHPLLT